MLDELRGQAATARRLPLPANPLPEERATLAAWLINAPGQSPAWSDYLISLVHLREIPGVQPAKIIKPGATHELVIAALDPKYHPSVDDVETLIPMRPVNAIVQFEATDELATHIAEKAALAICNGHMPAEPAFPGLGQNAWEYSVELTLKHHREGKH